MLDIFITVQIFKHTVLVKMSAFIYFQFPMNFRTVLYIKGNIFIIDPYSKLYSIFLPIWNVLTL